MHVVEIEDFERRKEAFKILIDVGGSFQSQRGKLLVNDAQYEAIVRAGILQANRKKAPRRGKKGS